MKSIKKQLKYWDELIKAAKNINHKLSSDNLAMLFKMKRDKVADRIGKKN